MRCPVADSYEAWRERLAQGLNPELYTLAWLDDLLHSGAARLFATDLAAMVVEDRVFPTGVKACCVVVAAGDHQEIVNTLRPIIEEWGKAGGCTKGLVESFPAWAKILAPHGYTPFKLSLLKDL